MYNELSDAELLALLKTDERQKAFTVIYNRYSKSVYNRCKFMIKDHDDVEDLVQEVFIKVENKYDTFKGYSTLKTWILSIAYRECLMYIRNQKKLRFDPIDYDNMVKNYGQIDIDETLEISTSTDDDLEVLELLSPLDKSLLIMKYHDGIKIKLIAEQLGLGESSIKMRLKRAKARLLELRKKKWQIRR